MRLLHFLQHCKCCDIIAMVMKFDHSWESYYITVAEDYGQISVHNNKQKLILLQTNADELNVYMFIV